MECRSVAELEVLVRARYPVIYVVTWEEAREQTTAGCGEGLLEAAEFVFDSPYIRRAEDVREYAAPSFSAGRKKSHGAPSCDPSPT